MPDNNNTSSYNRNIELLEGIISGGRVPHAFLFTGPSGVGKTKAAYHFAKMVLSIGKEGVVKKEISEEPDLFGAALATAKTEIKDKRILITEDIERKFLSGAHPDFFVLEKTEEDKKNTSVDKAREMSKFLSLTPSEGGYRVTIIHPIDDLSMNACNAILKVLEEPNRETVIIIICHSKTSLLQTIASRCVEIKFYPPSINEFSEMMGSENDINELFYLSDGSIGTAEEILGKKALETLERYNRAIKEKIVDIQEISKIAKEIKDNDSWKVFSRVMLKSQLKELRNNNSVKHLRILRELTEIIHNSSARNMDIHDTLKKLTYKINNI